MKSADREIKPGKESDSGRIQRMKMVIGLGGTGDVKKLKEYLAQIEKSEERNHNVITFDMSDNASDLPT